MIGEGPRADSNDQRTLRIQRSFSSMVLDSPLPFGPEKIKTQAVVFQIRELQEFRPKSDPLVVGKQALEHGILYALAVVQAGFGDVA